MCSAPFLRALVSLSAPSLLGRREPTRLSNQALHQPSSGGRIKEPLVPGAPKAENERSAGGTSCPTANTGNADIRIPVADRKKSSRSRRRQKKKTHSDRVR